MRCRGVGGEEVGVKCGCMQGCCEWARPGMRSWWRMMQVAVSTKTNRFGAAARQSQALPSLFLSFLGFEVMPVTKFAPDKKSFDFPNSPQNSNSEDLFQVMSKYTQYSREKDKTLSSE